MRALGDPWVQTFGFLAVVSGALAAYARMAPAAPGVTGLGPVTTSASPAAPPAQGARRVLVDARLAKDADTADLAAGLASAKSGDTVYVRAGVYRGSFHPADGVRLVGLGAPSSVVVEGPDDKPALWGSAGLRVASLTIRGGAPGIFVGGGAQVALESVAFETGASGVVASGRGTRVALSGCRLQREQKDGVEAREGAAVELSKTVVLGSKGCGVSVSGGASATLRGSTLSLNDYGVCADAASALDAGDSDLNGNLRGPKGAL